MPIGTLDLSQMSMKGKKLAKIMVHIYILYGHQTGFNHPLLKRII